MAPVANFIELRNVMQFMPPRLRSDPGLYEVARHMDMNSCRTHAYKDASAMHIKMESTVFSRKSDMIFTHLDLMTNTCDLC